MSTNPSRDPIGEGDPSEPRQTARQLPVENPDLWRRFKLGDEQAAADLYDRYSQLVYSVAHQVLNRDRAERRHQLERGLAAGRIAFFDADLKVRERRDIFRDGICQRDFSLFEKLKPPLNSAAHIDAAQIRADLFNHLFSAARRSANGCLKREFCNPL